tara:strand:- start:5390 stop:5764 length:375 start_codon:yes stop_codon:yes gene_type:complete
MVKRAVTSSHCSAKSEKLAGSIRKVANQLSEERSGGDKTSKKAFTLSKQAVTEMELLLEHAINNVAYNSGAILKYNGAGTVMPDTIQLATKTAFNGVLRDMVTTAGSLALKNYEASLEAPPASA